MSTNVALRGRYDLLKHERDDLVRLELRKERLAAFVVHDLKSPVNTLDLNAQILERNARLPSDAREAVASIRSSARTLTRMILNLLDISKSDDGRLAPVCREIDLRKVIDDAISELRVDADSRAVELRCHITTGIGRIVADKDLLLRVLTNLVENAIRYAPRETCVIVTASDAVDGVELRVSDAGRGVAPDMVERVFDAFLQVDAGTEELVARGCRGLGLTFCKLAVEAHGGRVWVEDAHPGAAFCLSLPTTR